MSKVDLCKLCSDLLLIAIRMRETEKLGNPLSLRKLIFTFIDKFENNCREYGIDNNQMMDAEYAIVALIDETVLSIDGECRNYWISQPVQLDIFKNNIAGEQFYIKLNKMLGEPEKNRDVLEVYFLCMSIGYEGKYRVCNPEERGNIIDDLGRKLRRAKARGSNEFSFHVKTDNSCTRTKHKISVPQIWFGVVTTTGVILLAYFMLLIKYNSHIQKLMEALK
jgi:type VI secretion system protein ImpK